MSAASPFRISCEDEQVLVHNEAFHAIRSYFHRHERGSNTQSFCSFHRHSCSTEEQESFRLHRAIIHSIVLPLFLLHHEASRIAARSLTRRKANDLERAFRGEARSAYAWLHCVIREEHDWYMTERCPACIVSHVLHSEPTIRFVAVACMLSDYLQDLGILRSKRKLPCFQFWIEALETAVREDALWGDEFWVEIEYRACSLSDSVKQLVLQCLEMCASFDRQSYHSPVLGKTSVQPQERTIALNPSSFARKQLKMTREGLRWSSGQFLPCSLHLQWNERSQAPSNRPSASILRPSPRRRSITT